MLQNPMRTLRAAGWPGLTTLLLALINLGGCGDPVKAERIFLGGNIVTANPQRPEVEALALRHGRILAVGNREEVLTFRGEATRVTRLEGRALLPGFVLPHTRLSAGEDESTGERGAYNILQRYANQGFTTVTVFQPADRLTSLRRAARSDSATVRVQAYLGPDKRDHIPRLISDNGARFRVLGLTLRTDQESLTEQVLAGHRAGYQVAIGASGQQAMTQALQAYGRAHKKQDRADARHRLESCTGGDRNLLHRSGALDLSCSFQSPRPQAVQAGPGTAERLGMRFTLQDRNRAVPDALGLLQHAVLERVADERVPIDRAIRALTLDAAWQTHAETDRGSLESGKYADLVMLDANPRKTDPADLSDIKVLKTWVADREIDP